MKDIDYLLNFVIPSGEIGPTGPTGPDGSNIARSAYLVTYNDGTAPTGITIQSDDRLPIDVKELDISNLITLDTNDETIKFNIEGYYKITFTVSAYVQYASNSTFNKQTDFVSLAFRNANTKNVYIGTSQWVLNETAIQLVGQGIISITNTNDEYELVNLGKRQICLETPELKNTISNSYFSNSLLTIVIEYLGRQSATNN